MIFKQIVAAARPVGRRTHLVWRLGWRVERLRALSLNGRGDREAWELECSPAWAHGEHWPWIGWTRDLLVSASFEPETRKLRIEGHQLGELCRISTGMVAVVEDNGLRLHAVQARPAGVAGEPVVTVGSDEIHWVLGQNHLLDPRSGLLTAEPIPGAADMVRFHCYDFTGEVEE